MQERYIHRVTRNSCNVAFWWQSKIEHSFGHAWPENFIQCCFQEPQLHERCDVPPLFFHFLAAMIIV